MKVNATGPVGRTAVEAADERAARSPEYRRIREMSAPYQEIAWQVIKYRTDHGLTQEQLAERVGTSYSQISRIESGRHATSLKTIYRIAEALDLAVELNLRPRASARVRAVAAR